MSGRKSLTRREFLSLSAAVAAGAISVACSGPTEVTPKENGTEPTATSKPVATAAPKTGSKYSEAPMLAALVEAGKLPRVDERLPEEPLILEPVERIGQYGGTWKAALQGGGDDGLFTRTVMYQNMVHWKTDGSVVPNVCESWEANEDYTEFTFHLRKGMKWSDGEPYTADDILFVVNDLYLNEEYSPGGPPGWMTTASGDPGKVEKIDDYTIKFTFSELHGFFVQQLGWSSDVLVNMPFHYVKQWHPKYNENIDALIKQEGVETWVALFERKADYGNHWVDVDRPSIMPWLCTAPYVGDATQVEWERNPYFWMVDPEGNQLPYIDKVEQRRFEDGEVIVMSALQGEFNFYGRRLGGSRNKSLFEEQKDEVGYRLVPVLTSSSGNPALVWSWNHADDEQLRELIHNKDFRIGMSHALNREEVNQALFAGLREPYQVAPRPESRYYDEEFAKQYIEYDLEKAEEHMLAAGCTRDGQGHWLRPDGKRLAFVILSEAWPDELEMYTGHWKDFGVDVSFQVVERGLMHERAQVGKFDMLAQSAVGGTTCIRISNLYAPISGWNSRFALLWQKWYATKGEQGEEPPEPVKRQLELWDLAHTVGDDKKRDEYMWELITIAKDMFYVMGTNLEDNGYCLVVDNFRNVPEVMDGMWPGKARSYPEQFFIEQA